MQIRDLTGILAIALMTSSLNGRAGQTAPTPDISRIVRGIDAANIERTIRKLVSFGTRNTLSAQDDPNRGIGAARDWLLGEFQKIAAASGGRLKVETDTFEQPPAARVPQPTRITDIYATLPGSDPDGRLVIVSGHYDSICSSPTDVEHDAPGANDDGSGVAAVLEMARVMSACRLRAGIVFVAVAGEEQGLLGSTHLADLAKKYGWNVEAMLDNDIIGSTLGGNGVHDDRSVRVFSEGVPSDETPQQAAIRRSIGGENDSPSRQLARFIKEVGERYVHGMKVTMVYRRDRYSRGGDHIPFLERGYPAVRFTEPNEDYRHQHQNVRIEDGVQYGDLPEFVDFGYVAQVARVNAAALAMMALAPAPPRNVRIGARLSYDTDLQWAAPDSDTSGYEIVWRETTEPTWTHSVRIGKADHYTAKGLSKDNYFFGVRSLDKNGHRSPVVFPRPVR